jgi:CTP synthase
MTTRLIFVTGGVLSSLGKGIASASIAALLQAHGYKVRIRKLDPYINFDPGTMNPYEHGEVYVTQDGTETDLDLGHYERFTGVPSSRQDNTTAGKIYYEVIERERKGHYLGGTVMVVPHITDAIKEFILNETKDLDFLICEIGGTVGDIEGLPFLEAIRQLKLDLGLEHCAYVHLTLVPFIQTTGEFKTKPSQHSVKELLSRGIQPDFLLCRSEKKLPESAQKKLSLFCNVPKNRVINARDVASIYQVPLGFHQDHLDKEILKYFGLPYKEPELSKWLPFIDALENPKTSVTIGLVVKYEKLKDAYKSLVESLIHAGVVLRCSVKISWISAEDIEQNEESHLLRDIDGIIVPGGFGPRGMEGKLRALRYARENHIPCMGICLGMQLMVIEYARSVLGWKEASSSEFGVSEKPVVSLITEWQKFGTYETRSEDDHLGGTMRLGIYPCVIKPKTKLADIYGVTERGERHRHRYEVSISYKDDLEAAGLIFSGLSPDNRLTEAVEVENHPWMIGVQYHPEFESYVGAPNPLFVSFLRASLEYQKKKIKEL